MKSLFKILFFLFLAVGFISCETVHRGNNYSRHNYPHGRNKVRVYKAKDGQVYRSGDVYRDRYGRVYQNGRIIRQGDVRGRPGIIRKGNSSVYYPNQNRRNLPPGQAKKVYGGEATGYAKGQVKNRDRKGTYREYDVGHKNDKKYKSKSKKQHYKKYKDRDDD